MDIPDFNKAFRNGEKFTTDFLGDFHVECREIGSLLVPTGQIVVCDPLAFPDMRPLDRRVPPGRYPVILSVVHLPPVEEGKVTDQRIACAMLALNSREPARWEMAAPLGQSIQSLKDGEFFGYPVDSGTGCFMDFTAAANLQKNMAAEGDYFMRLIKASRQNYVPTRSWADFPLDESGRLNIVFFSSGFGDGTYASYWGFDERGEHACLVTDFRVLTRQSTFESVRDVG